MNGPVAHHPENDRAALRRYAWLSMAAAVATMALKASAYLLTGSVGLLSDALESVVNLAGAVMALAMLTVAARPADEDHAYGHAKAEYFSSGLEGGLILIAAVAIAVAAVDRLATPRPLEQVGVGLVIAVLASLLNLGTAIVVLRAGRRHQSVTLEANAHHLLTDVWTSAGVVLGVAAVALTGWTRLDPLIALAVATNILWTGLRIVRRSIQGLMDAALPEAEVAAVRRLLATHLAGGAQYHALRTRQAGSRAFISFHVLVPGAWTVHRGHALLELVEAAIRHELPHATVFTHLESLDDPTSWEDESIDRPRPPRA